MPVSDSAILLLSVAETWSADPPPIPETRNKFLIRPFSQNRRGFIGPGRSCPDEEVRKKLEGTRFLRNCDSQVLFWGNRASKRNCPFSNIIF